MTLLVSTDPLKLGIHAARAGSGEIQLVLLKEPAEEILESVAITFTK